MNESDVKRNMIKSMREHGGYGRRIEDKYTVGMFDTVLIPRGLPVFMAEVKIVRATTFGVTPRQYEELVRIAQVMGANDHVIPVMIGWREGEYYFHPPKSNGVDYRDCFSITSTSVPFYEQLVRYYHFYKQGIGNDKS